ncbi:MAG: sugar ABC transporter ATP-binding protein [Candidatus Humimicrobiaceae bacterium]
MHNKDNYIFEVANITKKFPGVVALNNVNIGVRAGEILGLIGENGAGKSTLVKIITGYYPFGTYEGELILNGKEVIFKNPHDAFLKGIGYVPQEINVIDSLTVGENVLVGHYLKMGRSPFVNFRNIFIQVENFFNEYEIKLDSREKTLNLNISDKQLIMISRALWLNPLILLLDEPTSSLTVNEVEKLFRILKKLKEKGITIIFITHKLDEIVGLTDKVVVLRDGTVVTEFKRSEYDKEKIISAMVGRDIGNAFPRFKTSVEDKVILLRVEHLTVPHARVMNRNILEDVTFSLRKKEVLGIAGLVGAGRSELVNTIYGRYRHVHGKILIDGQEVKIRNIKDARSNRIGLVPENRTDEGLLFNFAIKENITLNNLKLITRNRLLIDRKKEGNYAKKYKSELSIAARSINDMVVKLSGGNQQKVVVAKVLMSDPKILLLDEPTKGIDVGAKYEIYLLIRKLVEEGLSIIVISSELPELLAICDRFLIMAEGKIVGELGREEATPELIMKYITEAGKKSAVS